MLPIICFNSLIVIKKEINAKSFAHIELENRPKYSAIRPTEKTDFTSYRSSNWKKAILNSKITKDYDSKYNTISMRGMFIDRAYTSLKKIKLN